MRTAIDNTGSENVSNCVFSPNDFDFSAFSGTLQRTYRMHSIFDRVEMQAHIDVSTALQVIYEQYGADVDIVKDNSAYFDFYLCVKGTFDSEPREELFWLDFTPLHFGGWRYWLKCLRCKHRCTKLYITSDEVACRQCLGLVYTSQSAAKDSIAVMLHNYQLGMQLIAKRPRMNYGGKPTRHGRRFSRYMQDSKGLTEAIASKFGSSG